MFRAAVGITVALLVASAGQALPLQDAGECEPLTGSQEGSSVPGTPPGDTKELNSFFKTTIKGGVEAAGVGLRASGKGVITLDEIPTGSSVTNAWLYWTVLADQAVGSNVLLNNKPVEGSAIGSGPSPNRPQLSHFTFRAEVTAIVQRSGDYEVEVLLGQAGAPPERRPIAEGASLVVVFSNPHLPTTSIALNDGSVLLSHRASTTQFADLLVQQGFTSASLFTIAGDGQGRFPDVLDFNGHVVGENRSCGMPCSTHLGGAPDVTDASKVCYKHLNGYGTPTAAE